MLGAGIGYGTVHNYGKGRYRVPRYGRAGIECLGTVNACNFDTLFAENIFFLQIL